MQLKEKYLTYCNENTKKKNCVNGTLIKKKKDWVLGLSPRSVRHHGQE